MASSDLPATSEVLLQTDASKHILDAFLGQGWDTWGASLGGSQASELMLELFSAFNLVALAVVSALFIWILAVAVAGTAHEGTPFGKRYSSLWMPLRFVGAMGALAPIFKGLSFFQVAILACIGFSINLGNYVWELGTDYFVEHGGQLTVQAPDQNVTHYAAISNGALESLTLQYYLNERRGLNITPGGEWTYSGNWFRSGGEYRFIFNGNAGSITVSCVDEGDALCRGKVNAVSAAVSNMRHTAVLSRTGALSRSLRLCEQRTPAVSDADGIVRHGQGRPAPGQTWFCQTGRHLFPRQSASGRKGTLAEGQGYSHPLPAFRHNWFRQNRNARFPFLQCPGNGIRAFLYRPQIQPETPDPDMANGEVPRQG